MSEAYIWRIYFDKIVAYPPHGALIQDPQGTKPRESIEVRLLVIVPEST